MNYKKLLVGLVILICIDIVVWMVINRDYLKYYDDLTELFRCLAGRNGTYNNSLFLSSIFMTMCILFNDKFLFPINISDFVRLNRNKYKTKLVIRCASLTFFFSVVYTLVNYILIIRCVGYETTVDFHFSLVTFMYLINVYCILLFAVLCYLALSLVIKTRWIIVLIVIAINLYVSRFIINDILFKNLSILDKMVSQEEINIGEWLKLVSYSIVIIWIAYEVFSAFWKRKDVI